MAVSRRTSDRIASLAELLGPGPWSREQLASVGWSSSRIDRVASSGALRRVRRGAYAVPAPGSATPLAPGPGRDLDVMTRLRAAALLLPARAALSHDSAAYLHGTWTPDAPSSTVHVTIPGQAERHDDGLRVHASRLPRQFVTEVRGLAVTTIERTAVDLARGRDLPRALVAIDGGLRALVQRRDPGAARGLREGTVDDAHLRAARALMQEAFAVVWSWPGSRVVRRAIDLGDPRSESPFESWSRGCVLAAGLPQPTVNSLVLGRSGRRYFGDLVWADHRLVGEADGMGKYGCGPDDLRRRLTAERLRQDDLEAAGWRLVRWVTGEPAQVVTARIAAALLLTRPDPRELLPESSISGLRTEDSGSNSQRRRWVTG